MALHESAIDLTPDRAHEMALAEAAVRAKDPDTSGWLTSNHEYAFKAHRVKLHERRGSAGTYWGLYRVALCGTKLDGTYGKSWSADAEPPKGYEPCPKCERIAARK